MDKESEHTTLSVGVFSWNVNAADPPKELGKLGELFNECDIIAVGLQEVQNSAASLFIENEAAGDKWVTALAKLMPEKRPFELVAVEFEVGRLVVLYVRQDLCPHIAEVDRATVTVGTFGAANKGAVAARMVLGGQSLCFVNAHLTAHGINFQRRNADYQQIATSLVFAEAGKATMDSHDVVFFFGDLNYRNTCTYGHAVEQISINEYRELLQYDQLRKAHKEKSVLAGYEELDIDFKPTFKLETGTVDTYDTSIKRRVPSWTDRIFYKGKNVDLLTYQALFNFDISDHKPVYALAKIKLPQRLDPIKSKGLEPSMPGAAWKTSRRTVGLLTPLGNKVAIVVLLALAVVMLRPVNGWLSALHGKANVVGKRN